MNEEAAGSDGRASSLSAALRVARLEQAERALAQGDLRDAELGRLELLRDMLEPVVAQVPPEVEMFDMGVMPGAHPRLFVDMIAFVEMSRDRRIYRFVQDRRHGRVVLAESEAASVMVEAITAYVARRLVEREGLLASLDGVAAMVPRPPAGPGPGPGPGLGPRRRRPLGALTTAVRALRVVVDGLGVATLGALVWLGVHFAHGRVPGW